MKMSQGLRVGPRRQEATVVRAVTSSDSKGRWGAMSIEIRELLGHKMCQDAEKDGWPSWEGQERQQGKPSTAQG